MTPTPHKSFDEALDEVRDVMIQYTHCADPTERAARQERLRKAEEEGQLEEAAAGMVRATRGERDRIMPTPVFESEERAPTNQWKSPLLTLEDNSAERIPATQRLGTQPETAMQSIERLPASLRLGPPEAPEVHVPIAQSIVSPIQKRKPGRPREKERSTQAHGYSKAPLPESGNLKIQNQPQFVGP